MRSRRGAPWERAAGVALVALLAGTGAAGADRAAAGAPQRSYRAAAGAAFPATPLPEARTEVAGVRWRDRIAVAGGFTADGEPSRRVDLLDRAGTWSRGPDLPAGYDHATLAVLTGRLWLVGGNATPVDGDPDDAGAADGGPTAAVYSLGPDDDAWRREASMRHPRSAPATVAAEGMLVVVGGFDGERVLVATEIYDPDQGRWRRGPRLHQPREHTAAAVVGSTVYAIAGRQGSLDSNLASVESLRLPEARRWRAEPDLQATRGGIGAATVGRLACVGGGEEPGGTIATVECLVGDAWETVSTLSVPRHGLALVADGDELHVLGGGPEPGLTVSDAHEVIEPAS